MEPTRGRVHLEVVGATVSFGESWDRLSGFWLGRGTLVGRALPATVAAVVASLADAGVREVEGRGARPGIPAAMRVTSFVGRIISPRARRRAGRWKRCEVSIS